MTRFTREQLSTGVTLNVAHAGREDGPAIVFLHGFPESHRTWRGLVPLLEDRYRLIMPDQRGFAGVGRAAGPEGLCDRQDRRRPVRTGRPARPRRLHPGRPRLGRGGQLGGGAAGRSAAEAARHHQRAASGHLPEEPDRGRRAARRLAIYHRLPRPRLRAGGRGDGLGHLLRQELHAATSTSPPSRRRRRPTISPSGASPASSPPCSTGIAAPAVMVPPPGVTVPLPDFLLPRLSKREGADLVVWGMRDKALLPLQLDGLDTLIDDLTLVRVARRRPFPAVGEAAKRSPRRSALSLTPIRVHRRRPHDQLEETRPQALPRPFGRPPRRRAGALPAGDGGHPDAAPAATNSTTIASARPSTT